ncbi:MAG: PAS domain-containing protein [Bradymonadia bacterium]
MSKTQDPQNVPPPEVPTAWSRRFAQRLTSESGDIVEEQRLFMLSILDADPNLIFVKDRYGRFIFVNQAVARLFGAEPEDVVRQANDAVHENEAELEVYDKVDQEVLRTGEEIRIEESFTLANGQVCWFDTRKRPLKAPNGETYVLGISVDITARRGAEAALFEANRRLEMAVSAGHLGLWDWQVKTTKVYLSPTWKSQLGYSDAELVNSFDTWTSLMHPDDLDQTVGVVMQHVEDPRADSRFAIQFRLRDRSGTWRWIASYGLVIRDQHGEADRVVGYHVDIHEQRMQREHLEESNEQLARAARLKDEFLANMSHELRTPLNAILGQSEAVSEGLFGPVNSEQMQALKTVEESGLHLLSLITDILDVAKINAGHLELYRTSVHVDEVCEESLRLVREQARRKDIDVFYAKDGAVERVPADRRRLKQILVNLLSNAKKFTPSGGRLGLEVAISADGDALTFTVWDTGVGIPEERRARLFEPFIQSDGGLNRRHDGTGLGLALVSKLTALHGGRVELESEPNRGSRFTVFLPLGSTPERVVVLPASPTPVVLNQRASLSHVRKVVIADDNINNVLHLKTHFTALGMEIVIAQNGQEAIDACEKHSPDLVLMDIQMPGMDGFEAMRRLRANPETAKLRIIALTALAMPGDRERALAAGADEYLSKPVSARRLLTVVEMLCTQ